MMSQAFPIDNTGKLYYNMKELYDNNPTFFYGCTVKKRLIIKKKNIPESEYVYANLLARTKEWNLSDENCKKAQLLFTKEWVDKYYFRGLPSSSAVLVQTPTVVSAPSLIEQPEIERIEEVIENAPPILELEDEEKFHDADGNIIEIETRGEKERNKIMFKVKDVMKAFDMPQLDHTLRNITCNYKINIHYKKFYIRVSGCQPPQTTIKKELYLTYKGLLRVLFASNAERAEKFQDWAEEKLFTIKMGTKEAKEILGTDILNIKLENYRAVFGKYSQQFPCIYLLSLGKVGALRETFGISSEINNDLTVYKYGFTCDIKRRLGEHNNDYGKKQNVNIELELFNYIDLKYTSEAESDIRDIFETYNTVLDISGRNELVTLNAKQFDRIKKEYIRTGREFAGATRELQDEAVNLKQEIQNLKNEMKTKELEHKIALQEEQMRTMEERKEKERFQVLVETNDRIHTLEKNNYELRLLNK